MQPATHEEDFSTGPNPDDREERDNKTMEVKKEESKGSTLLTVWCRQLQLPASGQSTASDHRAGTPGSVCKEPEAPAAV